MYLGPIDLESSTFDPVGKYSFVRDDDFRQGVYCRHGITVIRIEGAMERVSRRQRGDPDWNDLVDYTNWDHKCS
jgi:hypothetical protein